MKALGLRERGQAAFILDGYQTLGNRVLFDNDFLNYMKELAGCDTYHINNGDILIEDVINIGRRFLEKYYRIHDICFCSDKIALDIEKFVDAEVAFAKDGEMFLDVYDLFDNNLSNISPFDLPILFDMDNGGGEISSGYLAIPTEKHILKGRKFYSNVRMSSVLNNEVSSIYAHEITHSQVPKSGILNYQNSEVLPIFNELLCAYDLGDEDLFRNVFLYRLDALRKSTIMLNGFIDISASDALRASTYIYSTVQAFKLFDKYVNGDEDERVTIINGIQSVFDGKSTVEKVLSDNCVSYENSLNAQYVKKYV